MATTSSSVTTDARWLPELTCRHQPDVATFLLVGGLTPAEERRTMVHVATCGTCEATLAALVHLPELLDRLPLSVVELIDTSRATRAFRRPPLTHLVDYGE